MIIKRSEHGLGHLLPPIDDHTDWITTWWEHALRLDLGVTSEEPEWFDVIAAGRLTVTTPHEQRAWATYNKSKRRAERVGPFNFAMTAHAKRLHRGSARTARALVAPLAQTSGVQVALLYQLPTYALLGAVVIERAAAGKAPDRVLDRLAPDGAGHS